MRKILLTFCVLLCCALWSATAAALEIRSLSPSTGEPGARVAMTGGPFAPAVEILFGSEVLIPDQHEESRLVFTIPALPEGDYLVLLRHGEDTSPTGFTFRLVEPAPWIGSISPTQLDECTFEEERRVVISGRNFQTGAQVLVNQAAVPVDAVGSEEITFKFPPLTSGMHRVQVVNPSGKISLAHGLQISNIPEIQSVSIGADQVNFYEVVINGKNFQFNSRLLVNGEVVRGAAAIRPSTEFVQVVDCRTLRYTRYPVSREPRQVNLQIVNPGGEQSAVYTATIP
ncbi:IPT/TIG domain-containing protein [Geoalkalibacter halelectricus]|uniref:IPT/TIG domain-containing protein n=1 Tax=Geoalkalibacter halelectricus TaxID=2847045 RepID=A0ABY5ZJE4_9BACT|nr:IPT/TIG domain-containing protein [Geoalkalibacter halelectricus]MDO3379394.1 IPT/TIG domain-containing protein [Geoalkalibacter halelectricus]UWZ78728.1 IPT/TIG domain-containing protein [Geoalkalibacter halelectricus]